MVLTRKKQLDGFYFVPVSITCQEIGGGQDIREDETLIDTLNVHIDSRMGFFLSSSAKAKDRELK